MFYPMFYIKEEDIKTGGLVSPGNSGWHEAANNTDLSLNLYTAMAVEIGMAADSFIYNLLHGRICGLVYGLVYTKIKLNGLVYGMVYGLVFYGLVLHGL